MPWRKRRKWKIKNIKLYLVIIMICFVVAAVLHFIVDKGTDLIEEAYKITATDLSPSSIKKLKETYGDKIDADKLAKVKKALKGEMNNEDIEKLKEAYKGEIDPAELEKLKKTYQGNLDRVDLEKVKKRYGDLSEKKQ